jgi:VIT1/CCC1 family predicted Fe2+/Mn2+ transporter
VLDPLDRMSEILFGIIMVLTFTGSIRVAEAGQEDLRAVLAAALGCNLAWGMVDAAMYLTATFMARAHITATLRRLRTRLEPDTAQRLITDLLPTELAAALTPQEVEMLRQRLNQQSLPAVEAGLTRADFRGAVAVFLLVFLSTFPVIVPLIVVRQPRLALFLSNAVAVVMLFFLGWSIGRHAGRPGWRAGVGMVLIGLVLVGVTMALGG